jgi:endonuclease YncB( thermonuclease family)
MDIEQLKKFNYYNTEQFSLNGISTFCRVVDILDGDTITCIIPILNNFYKFTIRLYGIDTCEIKSKNLDIHNKGLDAKNKIISLLCKSNNVDEFDSKLTKKEMKDFLSNNFIIAYISCKEFDKFGRTLANVYLYDKTKDIDAIIKKENCISYILIQEKLAYPYFGDTKMSESEIKEYFDLED